MVRTELNLSVLNNSGDVLASRQLPMMSVIADPFHRSFVVLEG